MFNTYEELIEKFPIGAVYRRVEQRHINYYYSLVDIDHYKKMYNKVILNDQETCLCIEIIEYKINGYLFDGEYWYPATKTWDGWEPIEEDDINVGGF